MTLPKIDVEITITPPRTVGDIIGDIRRSGVVTRSEIEALIEQHCLEVIRDVATVDIDGLCDSIGELIAKVVHACPRGGHHPIVEVSTGGWPTGLHANVTIATVCPACGVRVVPEDWT